MSTVAELISQTVQVYVSNKRLKDFLVSDELEDYVGAPFSYSPGKKRANQYFSKFSASLDPQHSDVIDVRNATSTWNRDDARPTLNSIDLNVTAGQLIIVVGERDKCK